MSRARNLGELLEADGEVPSGKIDSVDSSKLTGTVSVSRLAAGSIDSAHVAAGAVDDAHISGLAATKLTGTVASARLGSGTANTTTFLRGDNAWATVNTNLVADTSPQLGGDLDLNSNNITGTGGIPAANLTGTVAAARLSTATTQAESDDSTKIATTAYVVDKITTLIGGAPSTLNDLNELAAAINDDSDYNSTLTTALATKLPLAGGAMTGTITNFRSTGIDDNAAGATAITIGSDETVTLNALGGSNYSSAASKVLKTAGTQHTILSVETSSTGGHNAALELESNGNPVVIATSGDDKMHFTTNAATRMTIDNSGNVGIGVVPETVHSQLTTLQLGETGMLAGGDTAWGGIIEIGSNYYRDSGGFKRITADKVCLTEYNNGDGNIVFKNAVTGAADSAVTLRNQLTIGDDGKISTWQGTGMTSHFNVGNRDIDVGTSTGYANRQERIGLMAADPWGTAAGIYLSVSRNTNQDGRSHPSLHFTGNHGAGQSEDYLIMSMNSSFYGTESVNVGSSANDANLEVNGHLSALKQPSFWASGTVASGYNNYTTEMVFSNAQHNIGSHYSTSTGRFTAPVAGAYLFTGTVYGNKGSSMRWTIKKNQVQYTAGGGSNDCVPHGYNNDTETTTCTVVLNLAANDYVSMMPRSGHTINMYGGHSWFSGVLVG